MKNPRCRCRRTWHRGHGARSAGCGSSRGTCYHQGGNREERSRGVRMTEVATYIHAGVACTAVGYVNEGVIDEQGCFAGHNLFSGVSVQDD